jgi:hypothetical protein
MALKLHKVPAIIRYHPKLNHVNHKVTSPKDPSINCWAYALGYFTWLEPDPLNQYFWPSGIPRNYTMSAFEAMLLKEGFTPTKTLTVEPNIEKIAAYILGQNCTHFARQINSKWWSSKLGALEDVSHTLDSLEGPVYGQVHQVYARPVRNPSSNLTSASVK